MPAVLITGVTGFLGAQTALTFLQNGYTVHGTLRSPSKLPSLSSTPEFAPYLALGHLKLFVTGSLEEADYSEAIQGVKAVVHTACSGTRRVMKAARGVPGLKAVVVTSSISAAQDIRVPFVQQAGKVIDDDTWLDYTIEEVKDLCKSGAPTNGIFPSRLVFYAAAKKYAELEAWVSHKQAQAEGATWSLATIIPVMILGPPIHPMDSPGSSGISMQRTWALAQGKDAPLPVSNDSCPYYVDVRDCAEAHLQAVKRQATGRFITSAGLYDWKELADTCGTLFPDQVSRFATGSPGAPCYEDGTYTLLNDKSMAELGIKYRGKEEMMKDAFEKLFEVERRGRS
ncbi:hypothetical protein IAT38_004375 [Cryptococcus sp. DSM 104549]